MGTKQLVVHDALDTTKSLAGSNRSSLTPTTNVASTPVPGAEMMTRLAPASRWAPAVSLDVNRPVDSMTTSIPRSDHGSAFGSRSANTAMGPLSSTRLDPSTDTSAPKRPWVESYLSRWAKVSADVRSLTATTSTSA